MHDIFTSTEGTMEQAFNIVLERLERANRDIARETEARHRLEAVVEQQAHSSPRFSDREVLAMLEAMAAGNKIEAIKAIRQITGYGLKESKDCIERVVSAIQDQRQAA